MSSLNIFSKIKKQIYRTDTETLLILKILNQRDCDAEEIKELIKTKYSNDYYYKKLRALETFWLIESEVLKSPKSNKIRTYIRKKYKLTEFGKVLIESEE